MQIEGICAIVSGGANGLGAATAALLAERGAKVAIFDIDEQKGLSLAREIGGIFVKGSVADQNAVQTTFATVESEIGIARILVNCAGIAPSINLLRNEGAHPIDVFQRTLQVNLVGTFLMVRQFASCVSRMVPLGEERGVIINTASIAAYDGTVGQIAYASSKAGVVGMTLPLARELCADAVRVMTIAPGLFETNMLADVPGGGRLGSQVPHPNRLGQPREFASLVETIIRNPMLNAEVIRLDAGLRLPPH